MVERRDGATFALPLGSAFALQSTVTKTKDPDRHCVADGCGTVLSKYNEGDRCSIHVYATIKPIRIGKGD
jgi:hypothetical protein